MALCICPRARRGSPEYLREMTTFPQGKHDDQVDSTAQFFDWFKTPMPGWAAFELARRMAEQFNRAKFARSSDFWQGQAFLPRANCVIL
jgi:hypothetical protein